LALGDHVDPWTSLAAKADWNGPGQIEYLTQDLTELAAGPRDGDSGTLEKHPIHGCVAHQAISTTE
jgi:hypothetical protein